MIGPDRDIESRPRDSGLVSAGRWLWEWTKSVFIALVLFLLIRTFLVEAFRIPTGSMENTLLVGDFLLVNKVVYGAQVPGTAVRFPPLDEPQRFDVVVFLPPHEPGKNYVKRVVGLSGDTLLMRDKVLYLNGTPQEEPYVRHTDPHNDLFVPTMLWQREFMISQDHSGRSRPSRDNWGPIVIPEGTFFVLGDNRDDSEDSRYWGFVQADAVKGKPFFIYYSFEPRALGAFPWLTEIRWDRIGGGIH